MTTETSPSLSAAEREKELASIRQLVADAETFQNDVERFPALLTEEVNIINFAGIRVKGREAFRQAMAKAVQTHLVKVLTRNELLDISFLRPDVALVSCIKHISDENTDRSNELPIRGSLTFVVVKQGGVWRIASAQTTPIRS